jgi:hypothetical protein
MKSFTLFALCALLAGLALSAEIPATGHVRGNYMEARTADVYTGACFANSEVEVSGNYAVLGWKIDSGTWQGVKLDGLSIMGAVRAEGTLGDWMRATNPAKAVLIVDQKANPQQRAALIAFAEKMGGDLFKDVVKIETRPIEFTSADIHSRKAMMVAGEMAKLETRALETDDQICRHEEVWYQPLTPVEHAMPAYTLTEKYQGGNLGATWDTALMRSAFVGTFQAHE